MKHIPITCLANSVDAKMFIGIIKQGIDAHLETFVYSKFDYGSTRLVLQFAASELPILVRRLEELGTDHALMWADDIRALEEYPG